MARPSLRALQAFEAVGRTGTVSGAARDLGVSSGAISQQIRNLEDSLGLTLLERRGRRVELTTWGRIYYEEIAKGFRQFDLAGDALARARNQSAVVLSALTSVVNKWITRRIFDWQSLHPQAIVRIIGKDEEPVLGQDEVDFRISYGRNAQVHRHYTELFRDWSVPVCSPMLIAGRVPSEPADLLEFPLLNVEWEKTYQPPPQWSDWARHVGAGRSQRLSTLSFTLSSSAIDAAVNGRGFALAQMSMVAEELAAGTLVMPFDIRLELPESYFLAWDRAAMEKPNGPAFHNWLMQIGRRQALLSAPPPDPVA
ncbi:LysR family transcriptional regulator [Paracoccus cavernae]|uniref:LysR family transcriptional regulator n=1 Tax=Paracoccus cavernae TaxID=1571207 RepID=A0ABT8D6C6_9RHOB|nr:LysR family transcriptional regulator [Paracoccus cavernae]